MATPIVITDLTRLRQAEALAAKLANENAKLKADLEYVAMMADIDIDEPENDIKNLEDNDNAL